METELHCSHIRLILGKWARRKGSSLPIENIPREGKIYHVASSWVSSVGLAKRNGDQYLICARGGKRFLSILLGR